ncbi:serine hydrolase [Candidatus Dojkabacteria bacterium]|uniref:Serine hydrolase n=1 Tax=Candidatus Dojkabacteria bacterium TaxID=2099670 RepID=A0A5C7J9A0_9BACT|nr:MAG: serine hydrolase [Candidatus Dojkabacteria bacterium]
MRKSKILLVVLVLSLLANAGLGFIYFYHSHSGESKETKDLYKKYPYLSKRILQDFPQDLLINFLALRRQLRSEALPYGNKFGFYFEYLPTGTSIGVNEKNEFHAASLFKVPVIIAYYHTKERLGAKDQEITLKEEFIDKDFGDLWRQGAGAKIKASEAVELAMVDSDNTAAKALVPLVGEKDFEEVYQGLDIDVNSDDQGALISAKAYASILKALYFSSLIDKNDSQHILNLLTKTKFPDKLAAGVPTNVPVAHKIGDFVDDEGNEGYRDCGIVYVPRRPYLLCMFSIGTEQEARDRMSNFSRIIYDYVSRTN